jgi:CMP-N-acetylneuraminic acid synthetase
LVANGVSDEEVVLHALDWLWEVCQMSPEYVVMLRAAHPLRSSVVIDRAVSKALATGCDAVVSVHETTDHVFTGEIYGDRLNLGYDPYDRPSRQNTPPRYKENGATYVTRTEFLRATGCRLGGDTRAVVVTPTEGLTIDHFHDFMIAGHYLETRRHTTNGYARLPLIR